VLDGLTGENRIAELCRREGISQGVSNKWSKDFMEAGKKRLAGDTARAATADEVKELRREARDLKEVIAFFREPGSGSLAAGLSRAQINHPEHGALDVYFFRFVQI